MGRRYFGTDGIRGRVGEDPMTVDFALRLASAAAHALAPQGGTVLIGKDTRVSGYMFESALEAGFVAAGVDVLLTGPLPTPAIAYLTKKSGADFGIVISASHNPYYDNGIKFFDAEGEKLSDQLEEAIESGLASAPVTRDSRALGQAKTRDVRAFRVHGVLQGHDSGRHGLRRLQDRGRRFAWRRIQGRAARDVGPRRGRRAGRLLAERPQHQRELRIDAARPAEAHGYGRASARGHGARRRRRSHRDGGRARHAWSTAINCLYVLACDRLESKTLVGPVVGTVMTNLGLELALRERGVEVPARASRRPSRSPAAQGARRCARRRDVGAHAVPRSDDDG